MISASTPATGRAIPAALRWSVLGLLSAWVGFWIFFVVASHSSEPVSLLLEGGTVVLPLVALAVLAWKRPLIAGLGLLVAGAAAAWFFRNVGALALLAAPALAFGAFFCWLGLRGRARG